ncbi:MAG: lycopene cyclase domain-containing protein [Trueperaceae bacterium]
MTYLLFHFIFILPLIALLALWSFLDVRRGKALSGSVGGNNKAALLSVAIHLFLAISYTTPWDNYLVYRNVWGYPEGSVLFTIGYVPFEEYLFFVFQTIIAALTLFTVARYYNPPDAPLKMDGNRVRWIGVIIAFAIMMFGALCLLFPKGTYVGLILVWAMPVLMLQFGFGADILLQRWRLVLASIALPTLYLWLADRYAIVEGGIWWINPELTTGIAPFGLPIEEALFFLMPNLFVTFGITLGLHSAAFQRAKSLFKRATIVKSKPQ